MLTKRRFLILLLITTVATIIVTLRRNYRVQSNSYTVDQSFSGYSNRYDSRYDTDPAVLRQAHIRCGIVPVDPTRVPD